MSYFNIPEPPLDPPEDKRARVYCCAICEEDIREGDDYYDIPGLGLVAKSVSLTRGVMMPSWTTLNTIPMIERSEPNGLS